MAICISKLLELQGRLYEAEQDYDLLCKIFDELRSLFNASAASVVLAPRQTPEDAIVWTKSYSRSDLAFYFERMADDVFLNTYMQHMLVGKRLFDLFDLFGLQMTVYIQRLTTNRSNRATCSTCSATCSGS